MSDFGERRASGRPARLGREQQLSEASGGIDSKQLKAERFTGSTWLRRACSVWIVRLALRRPYTFVVVAILIAVLGVLAIATMPTDIFPNINVPVVSVIWGYGGLSPAEMQDRITTIVERAMTTTVDNIEHMESLSVRGTSVIKLFLQPGADVKTAVAQVTAISQTLTRPLPPGISTPLIRQYNAASVPVLMLSLATHQL